MYAKRTVLVTGATGRAGGQVAAHLARSGEVRVRALSRDPARAASLGPGVEVAGGEAHGVPDEPDSGAEPDGKILGSHAHLEGLIAGSAGPQQLTQAEQLAAIGTALGRTLRFEEMDAAQAAAQLFPSMPPGTAAAIIAAHAAMAAQPEPVTGTVRRLLRRPALTFAQWARDHLQDFAGPQHKASSARH
jgi:uncharacterized protein YbjT (DUF2867 family)